MSGVQWMLGFSFGTIPETFVLSIPWFTFSAGHLVKWSHSTESQKWEPLPQQSPRGDQPLPERSWCLS